MGMTRLYTGADGQSHIEEVDPASRPDLTSLFRATEPGHFHDPSRGVMP